jgi:hypothetical protein
MSFSDRFIFEQALANLRLDGLNPTDNQKNIALQYTSGLISKDDLINLAITYARSN